MIKNKGHGEQNNERRNKVNNAKNESLTDDKHQAKVNQYIYTKEILKSNNSSATKSN